MRLPSEFTTLQSLIIMNLLSFQNRLRGRRNLHKDNDSEEGKSSKKDFIDDEFDETDGTAQLNKLIYIKKTFQSTNRTADNTTTQHKQTEVTHHMNMSLRLNTLDNQQIKTDRNQRSPEFAKSSHSERKYSNHGDNKTKQQVIKYEIKVTPPKQDRELSQRKTTQLKVEYNRRKSVQQEINKQPQQKQSIRSNYTPAKKLDRSEKDLSVYNQSNHKPGASRRLDKSAIVFNPVKRISFSPMKPRQTLYSEVQRQFYQLRQNTNRKFQDTMFPANSSIIFNNKIKNQPQDFKFERIKPIYEKYQVKLYHNCDSSSLIPGKFTSPNLYSALVILAEQPSRIANIFGNQEITQQGMYYVHLCKDGVWRFLLIDDFLPIKVSKKKHLLFVHTTQFQTGYEVWPSLLEKAVAKVYGTYEDVALTKTEGVKSLLKLMTGYPCSQYDIQHINLKSFSIILESSLKQKHIVVLQKIMEQQKVKSLNLNPLHSYQVTNMSGNSFTIRNYSEEDQDRVYTAEQLSVFGRLLIFKHEDNYIYTSRTLRHKYGYYSQLRVTLERDSNCYWQIWQMNPVYFKGHIGTNEIQYSPTNYIIEIKDISPNSIDQAVYIRQSGQKIYLKASQYRVRVHLCIKKQYDFTISCYGQSEVAMQRIKVNSLWDSKCCNFD